MKFEHAIIGVLTALLVISILFFFTPQVDESIKDANWNKADGPHPVAPWDILPVIIIIVVIAIILYAYPPPMGPGPLG